MLTKKIIAVPGAKGGGVANAILNDPTSEFSVRAITRNPESDEAKALAKIDTEIVSAE